MSRLLLIIICSVVSYSAAQVEPRLIRYTITDKTAVCNDNSPAKFYCDSCNGDSSTPSNKWIIYFEGGAGCNSRSECRERYDDEDNRPLTSSTVYADLDGREIVGKGLMSSVERENPTFYNFSHVYVPYCSSDAWLGRNYKTSMDPSVNGTGEFSFQGTVIFRGIIDDLYRSHGLNSSSEVILVGSSASGVGVLNHAQWVQGRLNNTRVRLIIDSAWFINFEMVLSNMVSNELGLLYNISATDIMSCLDTSRGYPCCLSPACHLMHSSLPTELPSILFIFSQYDIYALQFIFEDDFDFTFTNILRLFNAYGSAMTTYANTTFHQGNFSFFIPSCAQHRFLVPSEFWSSDGLLRKTTDTLITHSTFEFYNPLEPGETWKDVFIDGLSLMNAITQWYNNDTAFYYVDSCDGPICNPSCPDSVVLVSSSDIWGTGAAVIIFILAAVLTITSVVIKSMLYVCQIYILHKQKKFVKDMTNKEDRGTALQENLLPSCTQHCSVSCVNLTYRPDMYKSVNKNNKNAAMENAVAKQSKSRRKLDRLVKNRTNQTTDMPNENVIIKDINLYFNPGEMVAIMGPSGCGKTTLLDVLTGRRVNGETKGNIYINGISNDKMKQWFIENTGYVLQLATPFYEELTVRENLLFAVNMQLPKTASWNQKLERVEQVIRETGLFQVGDVTVGGPTGAGLSGGEKRRLSIAMQLLRMPNILFLDEPTSGLDASSSLSLLKTLHCLAQSGRAIILTIHQPRIEIFHMFDKILLICKGQVAYFGSPFKAMTYFMTTLSGDTGGKMKASNISNPADAILDILTKEKSQITVLRAYQSTGEPQLIQTAIKNARVSEAKAPTTSISRYPGLFLRLMSLESRASLRQTFIYIIYLPVVYCVFAFILGSVYFDTDNPVQIMSVTCLTSCSSSLFMSSIIMWLLIKPLEIFKLEHADGIAKAHEVVLQVFIRMSAICTGPLTVCCTALFLAVYQRYEFTVYLIILLSFLLVNQVWLSLFIFITCSNPKLAHRVCPLVAAICGFCCGFIVPKSLMPDYYEWIFYINPSYYAYAATTTTVLNDIDLECEYDSTIECLQFSGKTTLRSFGLENVDPVMYMMILMIMVVAYITAAILVLHLKLVAPSLKKMLMKCFRRKRYNSAKVFALNITANNVIAFTSTNNTTNTHGNKKSKFLEMDEQEHQVLHYYKPKPYDNTADVKTSNEDDQQLSQLKKHLSALSCDSIASSEPSIVYMHEDETERFFRSMQILLNRREMMYEHLGYHPTRHLSQPTAYDKTSLQAMDNGVPPVVLDSDQKSPQRMFAAPNRSVHVGDMPPGMMERNHHQQQPHPLMLPHTNDSNAWNDAPSILAYSDSSFPSQRSHNTDSGRHLSIESLEMSEQL